MAPSSAPPTRRSRRGELPAPLALKYFTRGALLEALEARGWRQFPASGLHTWTYYTPEGLERRANKEPTVLNVDYVFDDDGLYAFIELHGVLDELVRDKEAAEAEAKAATGRNHSDAPLWLNPSSPPPLHPKDGASVSTAQSVQLSAESEADEGRSFIPASDDDDQAQGDAPEAPKPSRKRPRLRTARSTGVKPQGKTKHSVARRQSAPSPSTLDAIGDAEHGSSDEEGARVERYYAESKRELCDLESELEALEQRVKKQRFHVHKLRIERDCHRERQRKLRQLEEQFFGRGALKKEAGVSECD